MNWITRISVWGIALITAALIVLVAAFNGIEQMVESLYTEYDPNITIRSTKGKTFDEDALNLKKIKQVPHVQSATRAVEEIVILFHQNKWANGRMVGIEGEHLNAIAIDKHLFDGHAYLEENGQPTAITGLALLDKIDGYISELDGFEEITLYTPLREASIARRKSPFKVSPLKVMGRMNYNKEVNDQEVLVPLEFAREQLSYDKDLTAIYVHVDDLKNLEEVKANIQSLVGASFTVKTAYEKNELIFKTSQSEKRIVIIILVFIFILAAFNLIASITMLYVEKSDNIQTLYRLGVTERFVFRLFFFEGLLIAGKGIVIGLMLGAGLCITQLYYPLLEMPNTGGMPFPIDFSFSDGALIVGLVCGLSVLTSFIPVQYLIKRKS